MGASARGRGAPSGVQSQHRAVPNSQLPRVFLRPRAPSQGPKAAAASPRPSAELELRSRPGARAAAAQVAGVVPPASPQPTRTRPPRGASAGSPPVPASGPGAPAPDPLPSWVAPPASSLQSAPLFCLRPRCGPNSQTRALRSRRSEAALTWVAEPGSGAVPQVVDEILAAVVLQGPTGTELGQQLQRLVTERVPGPGHRPPASSDSAGQAGAGDNPPPASSEPPPPGRPRSPPGTRRETARAPAPAAAGPASHRLHAALRQPVRRAFSLSLPAPPSLPRHPERRRRTAPRASLLALRPPLAAARGGAGSGVRAEGGLSVVPGWAPAGIPGRSRAPGAARTRLRTSRSERSRPRLESVERARARGALATAPLRPQANQPLPPPLAAGGQSTFRGA